ncbi:MAG TPA: hypothetical protein VGV09_13655 [Steroidobacteraceae bacterium]|nr:hypothetical protein [Steroidobacteraceae bacterium]
MTKLLRIMLLLATLATGQAFAQQDLSGPWQGKLAVDAKTNITIQFTFAKHPDGSYGVVLDSPDNPAIKNVPASAVSFTAGQLKLNVAALSGSYAATLKDGKLDGHWTQPGGTLPLVLSPYQKAVLSKAAMDTLTGAWHGPVQIPNVTLTFVTRFARSAKGELTGSLSVPEQGGQELPMADIQFADNKLDFKIPRVGGHYSADFANGAFVGTWTQTGAPAPLAVTLKKGDVAKPVFPLKLSAEAFAAVAGKWTGKLQGPGGGVITIVMRFELNSGGQYVGFVDSPDQGATGLPIAEADLAATKLTAKMNTPPAQFEGTLAGKTITGQWSQPTPNGPLAMPLTLTRQ